MACHVIIVVAWIDARSEAAMIEFDTEAAKRRQTASGYGEKEAGRVEKSF